PTSQTRTGVGYATGRSAAAGLRCVLPQAAAAAVGVAQPPLREGDALARPALPAAGRAELVHGERLVVVEVGQQPVEVGERRDQAERATHLTPGAEPLEVPR